MKKFISTILTVLAITSTLFTTSVYASIAQTSITKISSTKDSIKIKWEPINNADGYQIQESTDKNFKKNSKKYTVSDSDSTSKNIKKLKSDKKYYVRIRTYKSKNKTKTYSKWSKTKSVKTKKNTSKSNSSTSNSKNNTSSSSPSSSSDNINKSTCTNNGNHSMPCGNMGRWFNSRADVQAYDMAQAHQYYEQYEEGIITWEEYVKKSGNGYEAWNCAYCGKWTGNIT